MRMFLVCVGIAAWLMALAVLLVFADNGGALVAIAAGVFAVVAVVALGCERIIKTLEEIRDGRVVLTAKPTTGKPVSVLKTGVPAGAGTAATV
ncbi:hypothetical protein HNQ60_002416 [Povalibacter uvarum]|uniref:Uncharacterized protein n=1 Tax=Povalibacter uvarum TaxID=732238 RepID=A0A841HNL6_9GAMM|nr:hypothetical protein [Povalibacter uvarum]MBB6093535.1 hypothetical protein [Povalibacter uvarum]